MKQAEKGIVLSRTSYSESSLILKIITEHSGLQSFIFQGAKKKRVPFFPLQLIEFEAYKRADSQIGKISNLSSCHTLLDLISNPVKSGISFFIAEICLKLMQENHSDKSLYDFLENEIIWLNSTPEISNYLVWFLAKLAKIEGFQPEVVSKTPSFFDLQEGKLSDSPPYFPSYLQENWLDGIVRSIEEDKNQFLSRSYTKTERNQLLEAWISYYKVQHEQLKNLKSLEIIRAVFS